MAEYLIQDSTAQGIIDKVKTKAGITDDITGSEVEDAIDSILTPIDGTIPTKTSSNLTASGATVTVPAGYYAVKAEKSVSTASRANTTISVTADDTKDTLTITASNNQSTGYVTGANKTATTTITLTANGAKVTASDGTNSISKSVTTVSKAAPTISVKSSGVISASYTQSAGYVTSGTVNAPSVTLNSSHDSDFVESNIKSGVTIFGKTGTYKGVEPIYEFVSGDYDSAKVYLYTRYNIDTLLCFGCSFTFEYGGHNALWSATGNYAKDAEYSYLDVVNGIIDTGDTSVNVSGNSVYMRHLTPGRPAVFLSGFVAYIPA